MADAPKRPILSWLKSRPYHLTPWIVLLAAAPFALPRPRPARDELKAPLPGLSEDRALPPDAFDAVHHMLESLPEQLGEAFVQGQIQQTQVVLDSINSQLSARVMRSYGAFVHGMSQVRTAAHC